MTIQIPGAPNLSCVLGDTCNLQPNETSVTYSYSIPTAPGGSSATFSGATLEPDVAGLYTVQVTAGTAITKPRIVCYSVAIYDAVLAALQTIDPAAGDARARTVLRGVAQAVTSAQMTAWLAAPTSPPFSLKPFGGAS